MIEHQDTFDLLVNLTGKEWNAIATKVMWLHRVGIVGEWPSVLHNIPDTVSDLESWKAFRNKVNNARRARARYFSRQKYRIKSTKRKAYMRKYMAQYRHPSID